MNSIEQTNLKVNIVTSSDANKSIEELLYKNIARILYNRPEFKESLLLVKQVS